VWCSCAPFLKFPVEPNKLEWRNRKCEFSFLAHFAHFLGGEGHHVWMDAPWFCSICYLLPADVDIEIGLSHLKLYFAKRFCTVSASMQLLQIVWQSLWMIRLPSLQTADQKRWWYETSHMFCCLHLNLSHLVLSCATTTAQAAVCCGERLELLWFIFNIFGILHATCILAL